MSCLLTLNESCIFGYLTSCEVRITIIEIVSCIAESNRRACVVARDPVVASLVDSQFLSLLIEDREMRLRPERSLIGVAEFINLE